MPLNRDKLIENMTENLPIFRKKLKLTQEGLAQIIGVSRSSIMQIEKKKRKMTWTTFLSLVFLFDKNQETTRLLRVLDIYTEELDELILQQSDTEIQY